MSKRLSQYLPVLVVVVCSQVMLTAATQAEEIDPSDWSMIEEMDFHKSTLRYNVQAEPEDTIVVSVGFQEQSDGEISVVSKSLSGGDKDEVTLFEEEVQIVKPRTLRGTMSAGILCQVKRRRSQFTVEIKPLLALPRYKKPVQWTTKQVRTKYRQLSDDVRDGWWAYDNISALRSEQAKAWSRYRSNNTMMHLLQEAQKWDSKVRNAEKMLSKFDDAQLNHQSLLAASNLSQRLLRHGRIAVQIRLNGEMIRFDEEGGIVAGG